MMQIGMMIFPEMDQLDFTGPFEVLARIPGAEIHVIWKDLAPLRDVFGLILTPTATLGTAPPLDVLVVPGGRGQVSLMDDQAVLDWLRRRAAEARYVLSVCTGALTLGAAGVLRGRRATTHWNSLSLLPWFGAVAVGERVVVDGNLISSAGVSAGIDGSLRLAALLRDDEVARRIQLDMQYAPEPPFDAGTPAVAPESILGAARESFVAITAARLEAARRAARRLGLSGPEYSQT